MGQPMTKTSPATLPSVTIPRRLTLVLGMGVPLLASFWVLWDRFSALPSEAWFWEIDGWLAAAVVALMPINWWLETMKWAELMPFARLSRRWREVLYGTAWSLVGPFRMGAVVGRVSAVKSRERSFALRGFATASVAQWWCTTSGAGIALILMAQPVLGGIILLISAVTLGLYLGWSPSFWNVLRHSRLTGEWKLARRIPKVRRHRALTLSIARYIVMLSQFVLALSAFGHLAPWEWMDRVVYQSAGSAVTWGLTSLIPFPILGDLGIREAAALFALPAFTPLDTTAIVGATLFLWTVNLIVPALVGLGWQWSAFRSNQRRANLPK